ncbi:MAG: hypothetical protein IJG80_08700, partial [Selenomonadaceae bacterium]|nr:hypothetical protein [Selenomonadaceae bacterium]
MPDKTPVRLPHPPLTSYQRQTTQPEFLTSSPRRNFSSNRNITAADRSIGVVFGNNVLNESFYLVTFGGNYEEI